MFGKTVALDGLDLTIEPGEFVALLGPSGCGKTTALRCVAGFERPDSGAVLVDGKDITDVPANKRDAGMVFQSYSPLPQPQRPRQRRLRPAGPQGAGGRRGAPRRTSCWSSSACPRTPTASRTSSPAASSSASRWPARSPWSRACCCSTSRCRRSTPRYGSRCARRSAASSSTSASPPSSSPTTRRRPCRSPTGSRCCATGGWSRCGAPAEVYDRPATPFVAEFVGTMNHLAGQVSSAGTVTVLGQTLPIDGPLPRQPRGGRPHPPRGRPGHPRRGRRGRGAGRVVPRLVRPAAAGPGGRRGPRRRARPRGGTARRPAPGWRCAWWNGRSWWPPARSPSPPPSPNPPMPSDLPPDEFAGPPMPKGPPCAHIGGRRTAVRRAARRVVLGSPGGAVRHGRHPGGQRAALVAGDGVGGPHARRRAGPRRHPARPRPHGRGHGGPPPVRPSLGPGGRARLPPHHPPLGAAETPAPAPPPT